MASLIWQNEDLDALITRLVTHSETVRLSLGPLMEQAMVEAEALMRQYVEEAVTATGLARAAGRSKSKRGGGSDPGRIETGRMIAAIQHTVVDEGDTVIGSWGWLSGLDEDTLYFLFQENGTGTLPAMHALLQSFIQIREQIAAEVRSLSGGF